MASGSPARNKSASPPRSRDGDGENLYVAGLAMRSRDADIERHFSDIGKVRTVSVIKDPRTQESRGFAFVVYEDPRDADDAVRKLHKSELDGRIISVEKARRRGPRPETPGQYLGRRPTAPDRESGDHGRDRSQNDSLSRGRESERDYYERDRDYGRERDGRDYGRDRDYYERERPRDYRERDRDYGRSREPDRYDRYDYGGRRY